jgi:REP element-mobilizing transposase RayT
MTNHYHLVVDALRDELSAGCHRLNGVYAQTFNRRYRRKGHLFGDRFWSGLIEDDDELHDTCAYVLANPVRAGLCEQPTDWPWNGSRTGGMAWRIVRPRTGAQTRGG